MKRTRPWAVIATTDEYGWNERIGRRFATEARARIYAERLHNEGLREVRVQYAPIPRGREEAPWT